jgi:hypothetical protein
MREERDDARADERECLDHHPRGRLADGSVRHREKDAENPAAGAMRSLWAPARPRPLLVHAPVAAQRLVLAARLRKGARKRALDLATAMPTHPSTSGFERLSIYLSESEIVFLIEAPEAEFLVRAILDDPVRATEISPWLPLFDGPLHRADEVYHWSAREVT